MQVLVLTANRARLGVQLVANAARPEIEDVDQNFPERSGLQGRLAAEGFRVHWVREERVGRRRGENWEVVVTEHDGRRVTFRGMPGEPPLILMKRRA